MQPRSAPNSSEVFIRQLREADIADADRIMRMAFGTFLGIPDPLTFMGDADYIGTRRLANPAAAFVAEIDGEVAGSNFAANWGSVGFFGPLTVRPDLWDGGIGKRLLEPVIELFDRWHTKHAGLYTFANSQKHVSLYQRFGFWPRFLTAIMAKPVSEAPISCDALRYSELSGAHRDAALRACGELTNEIFDGLDVQSEIHAVANQDLGETLLLWNDSTLDAFAVCHTGAGTEAGSGSYYVKFGAARPGSRASGTFERLLDACEAAAQAESASTVEAGMNLGRHEAYCAMLARGFRTQTQGVAMQRPNEDGYNRSGVYIIDDWR